MKRQLLILGCVLLFAALAPRPAVADALRALTVQELVAGPEVVYDIAFLWFDQLAEGRASCGVGERPGTYRATLEAKTLGVAAWLTQDRIQRYTSLMELGSDGRLHSLRHESLIIKGAKNNRREKSKRYTFDHQRREVRYQATADG